jgi:hypothetical protein
MTSSPCSTKRIRSFLHGSQTSPYFFSSRPSSARCSIYQSASVRTRMTHDYSRDFLPRLDRPDIIEHLRQFGFRQLLSPGECLHNVRLGFLCQFDILRLRPPPFRNQESSESVNWVIFPSADIDHIELTNNIPFLNLFNRSILARIVTCRMMAYSVRHRFD